MREKIRILLDARYKLRKMQDELKNLELPGINSLLNDNRDEISKQIYQLSKTIEKEIGYLTHLVDVDERELTSD